MPNRCCTAPLFEVSPGDKFGPQWSLSFDVAMCRCLSRFLGMHRLPRREGDVASLPPQRWGQEVGKSDSFELWTRPNNQECLSQNSQQRHSKTFKDIQRHSKTFKDIQVTETFTSLQILLTYLVSFKQKPHLGNWSFGRP